MTNLEIYTNTQIERLSDPEWQVHVRWNILILYWAKLGTFFGYLLINYRFGNGKKHRHQRCKARSLCKTFFITNNCPLKEAGQKKYLSHNVFLTTSFSQRLSPTVFLTRYFSLCLSHNVLFTTSFSHLSPYIALTYSSTQLSPHNVTIYA